MSAYDIILLATLGSAVVGLGFSISSVAGSLAEIRNLGGGARTSEELETRRHFGQQVLRTFKLAILGVTVAFGILEFPPDPELRTRVLRTLLIAVIFIISYSAVHERLANKGIIEAILRERSRMDNDDLLYRALVQSNPWGVLAVDTDFNICFVNRSLERLSGWSFEELQGRHLHTLIPEEDRDAHVEHEREYLARPRVRHGDAPIRPKLLCRDGSTLDVEISLSPLDDPDVGTYFYASIRERATLPKEN